MQLQVIFTVVFVDLLYSYDIMILNVFSDVYWCLKRTLKIVSTVTAVSYVVCRVN